MLGPVHACAVIGPWAAQRGSTHGPGDLRHVHLARRGTSPGPNDIRENPFGDGAGMQHALTLDGVGGADATLSTHGVGAPVRWFVHGLLATPTRPRHGCRQRPTRDQHHRNRPSAKRPAAINWRWPPNRWQRRLLMITPAMARACLLQSVSRWPSATTSRSQRLHPLGAAYCKTSQFDRDPDDVADVTNVQVSVVTARSSRAVPSGRSGRQRWLLGSSGL